jgi:hypothetical protein
MSAPTKQEIHDAELKVAASRELARVEVVNLRASVEDMRAAAHLKIENLRAKMAQPSTLAWAAGFGFVLGKALFGRRRTPKPPRPARKPGQFAGGLIASFAAIVSRYTWRFLSGSFLRIWSAAETAPTAAPPPVPEPPRPTVKTVTTPYTSPRGAGDTVH